MGARAAVMQLADLPVYFKTHERIVVPFLPWWYAWIRGQLDGTGVSVPCEGCGARCCLLNTIELIPGLDDPTAYRAQTNAAGVAVLERRDDGACIHLDADNRCTVYDRRPFMCRTFDCRAYPATGTVVLDESARPDERLTLSCEAGLTRFDVVARSVEEALAMAAVQEQRRRATADGCSADVAIGAALMLWPRLVGGPALSYLEQLIKRSPVRLRAAVFGRAQNR